jgi:hypothetical protein
MKKMDEQNKKDEILIYGWTKWMNKIKGMRFWFMDEQNGWTK